MIETIVRTFTITLLVFCACTETAVATTTPVIDAHKDAAGITLRVQPGTLRLQVWGDRIFRVTYSPGDLLPADASLAVIAKPTTSDWKFSDMPDEFIVSTPAIQAHVNRQSGAIAFLDQAGNPFLRESVGGRSLATSQATGKSVIAAAQEFQLGDGEAIYGLGQHQAGLMNYVGSAVHLQQQNREVALPVLMSSKGYGILWDNPAITDVDVAKALPDIVRWSSEAGETIDYYVFFGPDLDTAVAGYRTLTGTVPMFAKWAWGLWQSRERYKTQAELLDVAREYRKRNIPLDGMVQDWQYWIPQPWGSHAFGENYPDPKAMMKELHDANMHIIISVWPKFDKGSKNYDELDQAGYLYTSVYPNVAPKGQAKWYDPFNSNARKMYWKQMSDELFSLGIDGWWLDATEPELGGKWGELRDLRTAGGPGYRVFNAYPLMTTTAVHDGQRAENSDKRVFILTRSAYAGQQRNAAVTWSGDIQARWDVLRKQIPAGLNFSISGIPYWNTDIGGFFLPRTKDDSYGELFARWFQFGVFCPMTRIHGSGFPKELWTFGPTLEAILLKFDQLRYRLLPYIYSVSWQVTKNNSTMIRPLVMDFRTDAKAAGIADQYMFGPALLVNPVTQRGAVDRDLYLPAGQSWYDFWTGKRFEAGEIQAAAPLDTMPLFVRAGSILPMGPIVQYASEQPSAPLEIRIYRGADGRFELYDDAGDGYDYEKGSYSTVAFNWKESTGTLSIGARAGEFPGMAIKRQFNLVWVNDSHGAGLDEEKHVDQIVNYTGDAVSVRSPAETTSPTTQKR